MPEMEYGQQAFSAMRSAEAARAAEARMNEEGRAVASAGAAPDTDKAIKAQEDMLALRMGNEPLAAPVAPEEESEDDAEARRAAEEEAALDTGDMLEVHAVPAPEWSAPEGDAPLAGPSPSEGDGSESGHDAGIIA